MRRLWVGAQTFLESKIEGSPTWIVRCGTLRFIFRDYKNINGFMLRDVLENDCATGQAVSVG